MDLTTDLGFWNTLYHIANLKPGSGPLWPQSVDLGYSCNLVEVTVSFPLSNKWYVEIYVDIKHVAYLYVL